MKLFICGKLGSHGVVRINTERAHVCFANSLQNRRLPEQDGDPAAAETVSRRQGVPLPSEGHAHLSLALIPGQRLPFATSIILPFQECYVDETRPCVILGIGYFSLGIILWRHIWIVACQQFPHFSCFLLSGPQGVSGLQCSILTC